MFKKNNINQLFNKLKDVLRHSEDHVTGRDAVLDISQLITLKKLEDTNRIQYFDLPDYCKFSSISNAIDEYEKKGILMLISIYCDTETNLLHINKGIFIELTNNKCIYYISTLSKIKYIYRIDQRNSKIWINYRI